MYLLVSFTEFLRLPRRRTDIEGKCGTARPRDQASAACFPYVGDVRYPEVEKKVGRA